MCYVINVHLNKQYIQYRKVHTLISQQQALMWWTLVALRVSVTLLTDKPEIMQEQL